jgi:SecD/SecF fusion protein
MQNKNAISAFAILLALACLYQLSFSWVASNVEADAASYSENKLSEVITTEGTKDVKTLDFLKQKFETEYLDSMSSQEVYPLLGFTYKKVKKHEINLGLDLQGGMNVTLEVSLIDLIRALSGYSSDETFNKAIANAQIMQRNSQEDFVTLFGKAFSAADPNAKLAAIFHTMENKDRIPRDASNEEVLDIIREEATSAVKRTEQVLRKRIDNLGVVQPKIQRLESGRILVELPGVKNKERVRKILQGTAKLEFWESYENAEVYPLLEQANDVLKKEVELKKDTTATPADSTNLAASANVNDSTDKSKNDLAEILAGDSAKADSADTGAKSEEDFRKSNPLFGILSPALYTQNGKYYHVPGPVIGSSETKDTAKVNSMLNRVDIKSLFFAGRIKFLWDAKTFVSEANGKEYVRLIAVKITHRDGIAPLEGDVVTNAFVDNDAMGKPSVTVSMNSEGATTWKHLTADNIGKSVAIVLDNFVYSYPTVQGEIAGGRTSITGNFSVEEAEDLANVLKAGKLPAPSRIIEEAIVGPTLGKSNVNAGLQSFLLALLVVLAYMIFYYSKAGTVANVALLANIFFILGVLASMGATLTLPGIAGIVLTIGMSVDANVLIYERVREEVTQGKGLRLALADGYKNAYSSIIDGNVTTLLTGIVLLLFGTGPIKGFATTLIIGICTSLFSAIFITRLIFEWMLDNKKNITFSTKLTENAFKNMNFQFVAKRKIYYFISGAVILAGLISFISRGFDYGVDFSGGRNYIVSFENKADVNAVGAALEKVFLDESGNKMRPEVKIYGSSNQVSLTTKYLIFDNSDNAEDVVEEKLNEGLSSLGTAYEIVSSQKVGPTIADDIKVSAVWSVIFAILIIFAYIVFRFKKWQFGLGALVAVFHDVMVVLSVFSIFYGILPFSLQIDQEFIAAILTVVGYSINDTVVVFDRIREFLGLHKREEFNSVVNNALNSTLGRTINTSLTTIFVLLMIFLFGGEVIRGFVFALLVGIGVGTYSSLFVATPIVVDFKKRDDN